jgi:MFS family permease
MTSISHSDDEKAISPSTSSEIIADKTEYLHSWRLAIVITSLFLGQFLMALDVNIINVAIPEITTHFAALNDVAWYGSAYLLTITAFQPSFGTIYRFFDVDVTYKVCLLIFEGQ